MSGTALGTVAGSMSAVGIGGGADAGTVATSAVAASLGAVIAGGGAHRALRSRLPTALPPSWRASSADAASMLISTGAAD